MNEYTDRKVSSPLLALQIWVFTTLVLAAGWALYNIIFDGKFESEVIVLVILCASIGSLPVLVIINVSIPLIMDSMRSPVGKIKRLATICFASALSYSFLGSFILSSFNDYFSASFFLYLLEQTTALWACSLVALLLTRKQLIKIFAEKDNKMILSIGQDINIYPARPGDTI